MTTGSDILRRQFDDSSAKLATILDGLSDEEFFWEPVEGCWTVHRRSDTRDVDADGSGEWVIDYVVPEPEVAPFTTLAWRVVHIAIVNYLYWDYAFGPATLSFDLDNPGTAGEAVQWLARSQEALSRELARLPEADLDRPRLTNWGERWPTYRIFTTLITEQVHHGAEISLLKDLYRYRHTLGAQRIKPTSASDVIGPVGNGAREF